MRYVIGTCSGSAAYNVAGTVSAVKSRRTRFPSFMARRVGRVWRPVWATRRRKVVTLLTLPIMLMIILIILTIYIIPLAISNIRDIDDIDKTDKIAEILEILMVLIM